MASMAEAADESISTRTLSEADFAVPLEDRYFEDYVAGAVYEYGYATVTEAEIIEFAQRFDPQPMHVDPVYAATGPFGGLIASGWHTAGIFMRLYADHYLSRVASLASPGIDEIRWPSPLRPGDTLRIRTTDDEIVATVSDEGPGIRGDISRIFQRFYTDRPDGEHFGDHSGLGLAISKQIVDAHRGTIFAENRTDRSGAQFTVILPRIAMEKPARPRK